MDDHERTLDEEGVPDLEGPLPEKAATGDPQEGLAPPNDRPRASVDYGTTAAEMRRPEDLDDRLARERPDVDEQPLAADEPDSLEGADGPEAHAMHREPEAG